MKKSWFKGISGCVFLILCFCLILPLYGRAENGHHTVKVGYYESENFQKGSKDTEPKSGYSYEYLQKIAYYTGWSYEYVYGDWSALYEALENGDIDLMAGVSITQERKGKMLFPKKEMGAENYFLYTDEERMFDGNKRENWENKRIGVIRNSLMTSCVLKWAEEKEISPKLVYFSDFSKRDKAFYEKKIDVIVSTDNSITADSGLSMVAKVGESPFYLAVAKDRTDLLSELDNAIEKIQAGGYSFNQLLEETYFNNTLYRKLSEDEEEWVKNHSSFVVGYMNDYLPFCGTDKNGKATGVMTELFDEMLQRLQLKKRVKVSYIAYDDQQKLFDAVKDGTVDVAFPIYLDIWTSEQNEMFQTDSVAQSGIDCVFRGDYTVETYQKIGVNKNNRMMCQFIKKWYPGSEVVYYDSIDECLKAVLDKEVKCTFINGYRTTGLLERRRYRGLNVSAMPQQFSMGMGIKKGERELISLLNHGLGLLDSDFVYLRTYRYGVSARGQNMKSVFRKFAYTIILTFMVIVGLVLLVGFISHLYRKAKNAEFKLQEATETKQAVLYSLGAAGWTMQCHADGTISNFQNSEELRKMLGYSIDEYKDDIEFARKNIHPDDWENILREIEKICKDYSAVYDTQWRIKSENGEYRWFRAVGRVAEGTDGLFFGVLMEMDEQKKAELLALAASEEKAKLEEGMNAVYRALGSAQWQRDYDEEGKLIDFHCTEEFSRVQGYDSPEKAPGNVEDWFLLVHPDDREKVAEFMKPSENGSNDNAPVSEVYRIKDQNGDYRYIKASGLYVYREDGSVKNFYGAIMDVHEQEMAHQKMKKAMELAESANKAKTAFLFNMSHDIRTPMNAIIGFAELMEMNWNQQELTREYLKKLKSACEFLLSLINNVLELARIESGKIILQEEPVKVVDLIEDICNVMEGTFKKGNLNFERDIHFSYPMIYADATKLREIFLNILGNAAKYTPEGGTITYTVTQEADEKKEIVWVTTRVSDTGIGMSEEFLPHVFEEFSREEKFMDTEVVGTGLGMPIVKQLVEQMKGTISVTSKLHEGSEFTVRIPHRIARDARQAVKKELSTEEMRRIFTGKRVLMAEDNPLNAEIAATILKKNGFLVEHVVDGEKCVEKMREKEAGYYDVILMDIRMPVKNGYEATREIRGFTDEQKANIPIFAMTANAFEEDKKQALDAGMNGHLAKPIDVKVMLKTLAEAFLVTAFVEQEEMS